MDTLVVGTAVVGSFLGAFAIQKAALEGLLRLMDEGRRRESVGPRQSTESQR
jgi:hypothetical protein